LHIPHVVEGRRIFAEDAKAQRVVGHILALAIQHGSTQQQAYGKRCKKELRHESHMSHILPNTSVGNQ
jgi:hypothetical protein